MVQFFPARSSYLCFFQQIREDGEPVRNQHLQLQGDDGQGQRGAFELPELVAGHTVLHLPGPQHRLEARRSLLNHFRRQPTGAHGGVPGHACAKPDGRNEVRVAGDEQGMELDRGERRGKGEERDQNTIITMSLLSHPVLDLYDLNHISVNYPTRAVAHHTYLDQTFTQHSEQLCAVKTLQLHF